MTNLHLFITICIKGANIPSVPYNGEADIPLVANLYRTTFCTINVGNFEFIEFKLEVTRLVTTS